MRSDLVRRLTPLVDRFDAISARAEDHREQGEHAVRLGLGDNGLLPVLDEIATKASEQGWLCGKSVTHLLVDRSFPPIFKRGVTKAEAFANQCEAILDQVDAGQAAGRLTFESKFGSPAVRA